MRDQLKGKKTLGEAVGYFHRVINHSVNAPVTHPKKKKKDWKESEKEQEEKAAAAFSVLSRTFRAEGELLGRHLTWNSRGWMEDALNGPFLSSRPNTYTTL